jgi:hypothetical protein
MRFRKLRIAWSVGWGVVAVLLCLLWMRSYWLSDSGIWIAPKIPGTNPPDTRITSFNGDVEFDNATWYTGNQRSEWRLHESPERAPTLRPTTKYFGFAWGTGTLAIPYWFPVILAAAFCAIAQVPWSKNFSLRTLLIATTLVAVVLGLIVDLLRRPVA